MLETDRHQHSKAGALSGTQAGAKAELTIRANGDDIERSNWDRLESYVHRYEEVWRALVAPLRAPNSILFRDGIDKDFEEFAMCHYTSYVNLARALNKIDCRQDDLKFAHEIWANMQHSAEVAIKSVGAFKQIYLACTLPRRDPKINTTRLEAAKGAVKKYRNTLHDPIVATAKHGEVRLLPKPERLDQYHRWTSVMYHRREEDFVPVDELLSSHFRSLASALQGVWGEIVERCNEIMFTAEFRNRQDSGTTPTLASTVSSVGASGSIIVSHE